MSSRFARFSMFALCAAAVLSACSPRVQTPKRITADLMHSYKGRAAGEFFYSYGVPSGEFAKADGSVVYRWVSTQDRVPKAGVPIQDSTLPGGQYRLIDTYNGETANYYCEIRVYADDQDIIQKFAVAVDSMGKYSSSRCSEVFQAEMP